MSNRSVSASVFNASTLEIEIVVNGGDRISIAGTGPDQNWVPQQPNPNPLSFAGYGGGGSPNEFGYGPNQVEVTVSGISINVPVSVGIGNIISLQFYIFLAERSVSWALLDNGLLIGASQG
jgi:hypothetical protein